MYTRPPSRVTAQAGHRSVIRGAGERNTAVNNIFSAKQTLRLVPPSVPVVSFINAKSIF